jgi:hypothetical protein
MKYDQLQPLLRQSPDAAINTIGKYGCYLLSLFQIGKLDLADDSYEKTLKTLHGLYLKKGWLDRECSIIDGPAILRDLTGSPWEVQKVDRPVLPAIDFGTNTEFIYCYRAFSGDGYHFKTAYCDTETERERLLAGFRIYTRMG